MSTKKTEVQKYTIIKQYNDFEIRHYPSATIATINSNAKTYKELASPGFQKLAGYIFGGNETSQKIAMTAPVQMVIDDSNSTMSFVMPSSFTNNKLPQPNDSNVNITTSPDEYVAVTTFGGFASDKDIKKYSEKLLTLLKDNNLSTMGNFRLYGYNPPYQLFNRKNEIVVAVYWNP
ncbi:MAG: heme-binding protein [Saprospiraceae bacterium]|nr:heme-binding protein [Saprospiraceae bacterium]